MPRTADDLIKMSVNYEQLANRSLLLTAAKKEKKKLDPKAKVRNRGTVCVPAEKAKDKKDHFPINDADQARNALARVQQYSSKPEWWSGSLKGLQDLVSRKVKAKYPKINVGGKEKKSYVEVSESLLAKYGQAKGTRQILTDRGWVTGNENTEVEDGQRVREWDGTRWKNYTYRASDDSFVDWSGANQLGAPTGGGKGGQPAKGGGGTSSSQYGLAFEQEMVKKIQQYLISQKIPVGASGADGKMGRDTKAALGKWQKSVGLPVTNQLDTATWTKLSEVIPEMAEVGKTAAPVDLNAARGMVDQARRWLEQMNKAYQAGQMKNPQVAQQFWASIAPFSDPAQGIPAIAQQLNGLVQNPQISPAQKKQIQDMLFNVNDAAMALAQWNQILSGQFTQTGQMPGAGQVVPTQPAQPGQPPPPPPPAGR